MVKGDDGLTRTSAPERFSRWQPNVSSLTKCSYEWMRCCDGIVPRPDGFVRAGAPSWLSSRNFSGGKICYANFYCCANFYIVLGPKLRGRISAIGDQKRRLISGPLCRRSVKIQSLRKVGKDWLRCLLINFYSAFHTLQKG